MFDHTHHADGSIFDGQREIPADTRSIPRIISKPPQTDARSTVLLSSLMGMILSDTDDEATGSAPATPTGSAREITACFRHVRRWQRMTRAAAGVTHDLRNLLMVINGRLDLARQLLEPDHPALAQFEIIERAVRESGDLSESLQLLARRQNTSFAPIDLSSVVRKTAQALTESRSGMIPVRVTGPAGLEVRGDAYQLQRALINLAEAIRKAAPEGSMLELHMSRGILPAAEQGKPTPAAEISVRCHAPRGSAERHTLRGHAGVRMWLAEEIIASHGGRVEFSSGKDFSVKVGLPLCQGAIQRGSQDPAGPRKVLVVTGDPNLRRLSMKALREAGCVARMASLAQDDWTALARSQVPHVAIVDMDVLDKPADEVVAELQAGQPQLRVVVIAGAGQISPALRQAAMCILFKPVSIVDVAQALVEVSSSSQDEAA